MLFLKGQFAIVNEEFDPERERAAQEQRTTHVAFPYLLLLRAFRFYSYHYLNRHQPFRCRSFCRHPPTGRQH
jgi:hypothetical protein